MNEDKAREAFEAHMKGDWRGRESAAWRNPDGSYIYTESEWRAFQAALQWAASQQAAETPSMPETWSVEVIANGESLVSIGECWLSGSRDLSGRDEQTILGAAKHLLSFIGHGLPVSQFDPDEEATQQAAEGLVLVPKEATREMCKAAVIYANGNAVYKNVAAAALEIEEGIYGEAYAAMIAAAPPSTQGGADA